MKKIKKMSAMLMILLLGMNLAACGNGNTKNETETVETATAEATVESTAEAGESDFGNTKELIDITKIEAGPYVKLGAYTGFDLDLQKQEISDEEVDQEADLLVQELAEKKDTGEGAKVEEYLDLSYKLETSQGVMEEDDNYQMYLGYNELGEDVDAALLGAKPGDTFEVPADVVTLYGLPEGTEGHYSIEVKKVYRYEVPELTDELVAANTDCKTVDEYRQSIREELQTTADRTDHYNAEEQAIGLAVANAEFNGYPQEVYDSVYGQIMDMYQYYAEAYGMSMEDMMGEDNLEEPVMNEVNVMLTVKAIAEAEKIELTDEAYRKYVTENCSDYGYDDPDALIQDLGESYLRDYALRSLVGTYILDNSTVHELTPSEYYEKYYSNADMEFDAQMEENMEDETELAN